MVAPTLSAGAAAGAGGSLVAERNASLASCLVRSTNAICCDPSTAHAPLSPQPAWPILYLYQNETMRSFDSLSEREILSLAVSLEEEDERIYGDFADGLRENYPATAEMFEGMRQEESGHRRRLIELHQARFGDPLPLIRLSR